MLDPQKSLKNHQQMTFIQATIAPFFRYREPSSTYDPPGSPLGPLLDVFFMIMGCFYMIFDDISRVYLARTVKRILKMFTTKVYNICKN